MERFQAFEAIDRQAYSGHKVLQTRFVDTDEKSRFMAEEHNAFATDEFFAQTTTMSTGRLVDAIAAYHRGSRMVLDAHRAFLRLPEAGLLSSSLLARGSGERSRPVETLRGFGS